MGMVEDHHHGSSSRMSSTTTTSTPTAALRRVKRSSSCRHGSFPRKGDPAAPGARAHSRHIWGLFGGMQTFSGTNLGQQGRPAKWRHNSGAVVPRDL